MAMSLYYRRLRQLVGHQLLMMPGVAAVIREASGRLLLQEKAAGLGWSLPAGAIEPGEDPTQALRREVLEETGLIVEPQRILGVFGGPQFRHTYRNGDTVEYLVVLYRCNVTGQGTGRLDPETRSLRYFAAAELPQLALPYPEQALFGGD
ncbi:MAG TPA: NUDIX domain-containing protein [Steroidobacteraceae bacterium]|jgi:8-oxo-dGTP pyrophosphatase MutT (NUDIX family)|nr:NUDIX domain-containing protein [Steroidobacteraceae bacterium]